MKLAEYQRVECSKFRTPPIDFAAVRTVIDDLLLSGWQDGQSAEHVVQAVLKNPAVTGTLTAMLSPSLTFQRHVALDEVAAQEGQDRSDYQLQCDAYLAAIEATLGEEANKYAQEYEEKRAIVEQGRLGYGAAEARLSELRSRVERHLDQFGGVKGYQVLLDINQQVAGIPGASVLAAHAAPAEIHRPMARRADRDEPRGMTEQPLSQPSTQYALPQERLVRLRPKSSWFKRIRAFLSYKLW